MENHDVHRRITVQKDDHFPAYVVWELTLRCDQACAHCGSRAGAARDDELNTEEALKVVKELQKMRAREVVLIGGEAYLHPGFLDVVRALKAAGIRPTMTTGGRGITEKLAREMAAAGVHSVSVSVDGLENEHRNIRRNRNGLERTTHALRVLKAAGIKTAANTNINRVNIGVLEALYEHLKALGIYAWQVQITIPLGRAADRPQMLLQPFELLDLVPRLAALKSRAYDEGILIMPGNNLGYFGKEEALLRSVKRHGRDHFQGCQAGQRVMGIESDGGIKGCPSLQSADYIGGNVRESSLQNIWDTSPRLSFSRKRTREDLWGFCATCPFAETCLGGCTFSAHALFQKPGNNPYCHYRAQDFARRGLRERLVPLEAANGDPFDCGRYGIEIEKLDAAVNVAQLPAHDLVAITRRPKKTKPSNAS